MKLRRVDEGGRLGLVTTRLAIDDAGLPSNTDEVGVALGTATSGVHSTVQHLQKLATGGPTAVPAAPWIPAFAGMTRKAGLPRPPWHEMRACRSAVRERVSFAVVF